MPKSPPSTEIERLGVNAVEKAILELHWLFREQTIADYGIDAHAEVVEPGGKVTGKLLAIQIKSGRTSYFARPSTDGWTHYIDVNHAEYWLRHSLPVIVVLYDEVDDKAYWQLVTKASLIATRTQFKIEVPFSQEFGLASIKALSIAADGDPYTLRLRQLQLALPWMELLREGTRILIEAEEWVNKSSGRGDIQIVSADENGNEKVLGSWGIFAGLRPYAELLQALVPWADLDVDEEAYDVAEDDAWRSECVYIDGEGDEIMTMDFETWKLGRPTEGLRPYKNGAGEVDFWRLELTLNDVGKGFLAVNEFAESTGKFLVPGR